MKLLKKALFLLIAIIMIFSSFSIAMAVNEEEYDHNPQVFVTGIGSAKIYYEDDPEQTSLF